MIRKILKAILPNNEIRGQKAPPGFRVGYFRGEPYFYDGVTIQTPHDVVLASAEKLSKDMRKFEIKKV